MLNFQNCIFNIFKFTFIFIKFFSIIGKERSKEELEQLELCDNMLYMLATLSEADICALNESFSENIGEKLQELVERYLEVEYF